MYLLTRRKIPELTPIEEVPRDQEFVELLEQVKKSDFLEPLLVSKDNLVVDGCRRWLVAHELGIETVDVLVLQEDYTREELLRLRAALHCARRKPRLDELKMVAGCENPDRVRPKPTPREIEILVNDMFCAQGLGPSIMMAITQHVPICVVPCKTEEDQSLESERALREVGWKSE